MWSNSKTCVYWHGEQKDPEWHALRKFSVGSSACHGLAYGCNFGKTFQGVDHYLKLFNGTYKIPINAAMQLGIDDEPKIYAWHLKELNRIAKKHGFKEKVQFTTVGIAISKKNPNFRGSPDSLIYDPTEPDPYGIGEYKRTTRLYPQFRNDQKPWSSSPLAKDNPTNLYDSHYAQVQHLMWVTGRSWCDYVVCCFEEESFYRERIDFNPKYWKKLSRAIENTLDSVRDQIEQNQIPAPFDADGILPLDQIFETDENWKRIVPEEEFSMQ